MDRILEKKPFIIRYRNYLIAGVVFLAFLIYVVVNSMGGRKLRTEADKLSVETVRQDKFLEYGCRRDCTTDPDVESKYP